MTIFNKSLAYIRETYGGFFLGIIFFFLLCFINPQFYTWKGLIKEFPAVGMCAFGFLLTFLSIILQGDNETIKWMKSREILFKRFISLNKRIVILSLVLSFYSYFLVFFNFTWLISTIDLLDSLKPFFQKISVSLFVGLVIWFLNDLAWFINVFYLLIKK